MYQFLREFQTDNTLAEAKDLSVVTENSTLDGKRIVSGDGPDPRNFVC